MKQLTEQIVRTNEYFQTTKATNAVANKDINMPNCTTFCMCAWHWLINANQKYTLFKGRGAGAFGNAKDWYPNYLFEKGDVPKIGSFACWDGTYGHVALVYGYEDLGNGYYNIKLYQSNYTGRKYPSKYFENVTYKVKVGCVTLTGLGAFQGFLYHPYYKEEQPVEPLPATRFVKGKVYTTQYVIRVRTGPGTNYKQKTKAQLTIDGQKNANASGCLLKGTKITCLECKQEANGNTWIRIPSGWICGCYQGTYYVK